MDGDLARMLHELAEVRDRKDGKKKYMETSIEKEMDQGNRAFGEMLKAAKGWLKDLPPEKIAKRSGAFFHRENSILELQSLNQTVRIAIPNINSAPSLGHGINWCFSIIYIWQMGLLFLTALSLSEN